MIFLNIPAMYQFETLYTYATKAQSHEGFTKNASCNLEPLCLCGKKTY